MFLQCFSFSFFLGDNMGQYFENVSLPSKMVKTECVILGQKFIFYTDNGVFSKDGLDFGSRLLLESIPLDEVGGKVLDLGCGYGVFGIILNKLLNCDVDMVDVNLRALHLSNINIKENHCSDNIKAFQSDVYKSVKSKYSCIITNPPIRAGKKVVYDILMNARYYLEKNGVLFLVIRKEQGAKSLIVDLEKIYTVKVVNKKKGFFIIQCNL